jgi:hypothetical protein
VKNSINKSENGKVGTQNYGKENIGAKHMRKLPSFETSSDGSESEESSENEEKLEEYFRKIEVFEKKGHYSFSYLILSLVFSLTSQQNKRLLLWLTYRIRS